MAKLISIFFVLSFLSANAQDGIFKKFWKVSRPEKFWAISHPFVALKAHRISQQVLDETNKLLSDSTFDGDLDGGQLDAFRHTLWMAWLVREISCEKAWSLGIAHEKGNWLDFKKQRAEEKYIPDSISMEMDLQNNTLGIQLGNRNKHIALDSLIVLVKQMVVTGQVWIISKNKQGQYLDCDGKVLIKESYYKHWVNNRCLIRSNFNSRKAFAE